MRRIAELDELAEVLRDLARSATDGGNPTSLDEVLAAFGHTRQSLSDDE